MLTCYGFRQSMSGTGNWYDKAIMKTFVHTLKTGLFYFERYEALREAQSCIFASIKVFYNRQRRHSSLNCKAPVKFERLTKVA
jgi:transposase InsO family protein